MNSMPQKHSRKSRFALKIRKQIRPIALPLKNSPVFVKTEDSIVVETNRGEELGIVQKLPKGCERAQQHNNLKIHHILRQATKEDLKNLEKIEKQETDYVHQANKLIKKQKLSIKVITGELLYNGKKITLFYQNMEDNNKNQKHKKEKPNFKQLGKELYQQFNIPVELRDAGNRGEAKVLGGLGSCGKQLCCCGHLTKGKHVSIKMAKEQSIPINIQKISGQCGKLMCCIEYEHGQYENGKLPDLQPKQKVDEDESLVEYAKMFKEKEEE